MLEIWHLKEPRPSYFVTGNGGRVLHSEQLIYEVQVQVEPQIEAEYLFWLMEHIAKMLGLPGFVKASLAKLDPLPGDPAPPKTVYRVQYHLDSELALENYLQTYAAMMRKEGLERFSGRFQAQRAVIRSEQLFSVGNNG